MWEVVEIMILNMEGVEEENEVVVQLKSDLE